MSCAINQSFAVKNFGVSCLASNFDLSNSKMKINHMKSGFKYAKILISIYCFLQHTDAMA